MKIQWREARFGAGEVGSVLDGLVVVDVNYEDKGFKVILRGARVVAFKERFGTVAAAKTAVEKYLTTIKE